MASEKVPGPDQGYSWLVALACFFLNFTLMGIARSISILYLALVEMYGVAREEAILPFSLRVTVKNMSGPLIGLLGQKYGIRSVTILGGIVAALGSILCYFAPNIIWITVFWGVIHGTGFGLSTVLHMMSIGQYFDKYKASALGLGYSGDCFGTFVFPVIMESLLETYDIKGTFLILGGIVLHVIPMAMILKKPPWLKKNRKKENLTKKHSSTTILNNVIEQEPTKQGIPNEAFVDSKKNLCLPDLYEIDENDSISVISDDPPSYHSSVRRKPVRVSRTSLPFNPSPRSGSHSFSRKNSEFNDIRENAERHNSLPPLFEKEVLPSGNLAGGEIKKFQNKELFDTTNSNKLQSPSSIKRRRESSISQLAHEIVNRMRTASFASQVTQDGFLTTFQLDNRDDSDTESVDDDLYCDKSVTPDIEKKSNDDKFDVNNTQELILSASSIKLDSHQTTKIMKEKEAKKLSMLQILLRVNAKPMFILISASLAVFSFLFVGVLTIIIDYAVDNGVSHDEGKYLIIGFSVTDLIGRLTFGQVIDRKLMKMKNYACITMLLMGILVAVIPLNKSFNFMLVIMSMYGFVQGGSAIMFPILVDKYMEKREEAVAMGCVNFYGGLLMLQLAPMIGFFRDNTGSYDWVFHILGISVLVVALIWQLEPLIIKHQNKKKLRKMSYIMVTKL